MQLDRVKRDERRSIIALYHLFLLATGASRDRPNYQPLLQKYASDLDELCVEAVVICLLRGLEFPWEPTKVEALHTQYFETRNRKTALRLGSLIESMFTLRLAELNRLQGNCNRVRELIAFAVENNPGNKGILDLENRSQDDLQEIINERALLLGGSAT
jgi:hypothetical protein